jgi:hypothetical protein
MKALFKPSIHWLFSFNPLWVALKHLHRPPPLRFISAALAIPPIARLIGGAASLALIAVVGSGCGGIHASKSVSPLDFFLPGLMQNAPLAPAIPSATNALAELAQASQDFLSIPTQPKSSL